MEKSNKIVSMPFIKCKTHIQFFKGSQLSKYIPISLHMYLYQIH